MSSRGLNVCTLAGNVAATPVLKEIQGGNELAEFTIYVDRIPSRKENDSFTIKVTVWAGTAAFRKIAYVDKGSLIIVTGKIDASPYIAKADGQARAGLQVTATDIFLDSSPRSEGSSYSDIPGLPLNDDVIVS